MPRNPDFPEAPDRRYYLVAGSEPLGILANEGFAALRWATNSPGRTVWCRLGDGPAFRVYPAKEEL